MDPVAVLITLAFAGIFAGAVAQLIRGRDPLALDVTLIFSGLALVYLLTIVQSLVGPPPVPLAVAALLLLLAQPFFVLRLVSRIRSLPRWLLPLAGVAYLVTTIPTLVVAVASPGNPVAGVLLLGAIAVFGITDIVAAGYLAAEAIRRTGSARIRLAVAAIATFGLAAVILGLGAASAINGPTSTSEPESGTSLTSVITLLSALAYLIAFLPPRWLRRLWQANAAYGYSQELMATPASDDETAIWMRLADASARVAGSDAAVVIVHGSTNLPRIVAAAGPAADLLGNLDGRLVDLEVIEPASGVRGVERIGAGQSPLFERLGAPIGARFASAVSFAVDAGRSGLLIHFSRHASLFSADDASLLEALGRVAGLLVERRAVLAEQEDLAQRLTVTNAALQAASQAKSDFVASMSHELRTPLTAIIGFSDLMRTEPRQGDAVVVPSEWIEHIHRSGHHLLGLINDVLDLAKVEAGRLDLSIERMDLPTAVLESVAGLRPLADRKSIAIETAIDALQVDADRGRLRQIMYNLLSNAIKYTPDGGRITIEASHTGDEVALSVADTGLGISPDDLLIVFEEFRQVGNVADRQPGTGLGLALCRRLVEAHGGRIEVESAVGSGSRFTVYLPDGHPGASRLVQEPDRGAATGRSAGPAPRSTVLVIEDDPSAVRLIRTYLEGDGYSVRVAADGEQGLVDARDQRPDAIILDVLLSGIDGWEVLRRLKSDPVLRDVPVVIVTIVDEREVGLALGAVDYLVKPVDRAALVASLARYTSPRASGAGVRVLAVDDDPATLDMIEAALTPDGYGVTRAASGEAGLSIARSTPFDLVICDILMPDLDGFGVVAELAADPRTREVPILILTGHELTEHDRERLNGKIMGIMAKGDSGKDGLRTWLLRAIASAPAGSEADRA